MSTSETRRAVLRELIRSRFDGVARQLAIAAGKPEGQINDMLSTPPRKSFGEKVARQLEQKLGLQSGYFDQPSNSVSAGKVAPFVAQQSAPYKTGTIGEILAILERIGETEQKEALGAIRYIEYQFMERLKKSTSRAGK